MIKINTIASGGGSKTTEFVVDADLYAVKKGNILEIAKEMWHADEVIVPWFSWSYRQYKNLALVRATKVKILQAASYSKDSNGDVNLQIANNITVADIERDGLVHAFGQVWKVTKRTNGPAHSILDVKPLS